MFVNHTKTSRVMGESFSRREKRTKRIGRRPDIKNHDFDVLGCKEENHLFPNAFASTGNDYNLFAPIPFCGLPIIESASVQDTIEPSCQAEID